MDQEQKMKAVVKAAGECWHEWPGKETTMRHCQKCGTTIYNTIDGVIVDLKVNPSPTDHNELFRLADKLGAENDLVIDRLSGKWSAMYRDNIWQHGDTAAEALLKALYEAVKVQKPEEAPQ